MTTATAPAAAAGVAEPCLSIQQNEKFAYEYTAKVRREAGVQHNFEWGASCCVLLVLADAVLCTLRDSITTRQVDCWNVLCS